ncbi:MAG: hypothetical protein WC620_03750 [Methanoregula sp.]|jgi:hypothetical protein
MPDEKRGIHIGVEGTFDQAIVQKIVNYLGFEVLDNRQHPKKEMRKKIIGFNVSAESAPWIVLVDLDTEEGYPCASKLVREWLPNPADFMCFRVATREIEAWLLADRERLAQFLCIPLTDIPLDPESIVYPKECLINLARHSRDTSIVTDLVPRRESGRTEGPGYTNRMIKFISHNQRGWRHDIAATSADSLNRFIRCLNELKIKSNIDRVPRTRRPSRIKSVRR